jgi:hypothetical protein
VTKPPFSSRDCGKYVSRFLIKEKTSCVYSNRGSFGHWRVGRFVDMEDGKIRNKDCGIRREAHTAYVPVLVFSTEYEVLWW